jgi:hypothetical protein
VAIVAAQEFQWVFSATKKSKGKAVWFDWTKAERRVSCYYFYILDREFGPAFIKICTYFPYPTKIWLNGHEWAKRQATQAGITFKELANGFASCADPAALQSVCDRLGPADIQAFFDYWTDRIPTPFTADDRTAGYWWDLSMRQVEVSRTVVLDDPRRARSFFESLVADNIGIGRPDQVAMVFARQVRTTTKEPCIGRVFSPGIEVKMDFAYKHSRVKQYLKEGRALRIETVINKPWDLTIRSRLEAGRERRVGSAAAPSMAAGPTDSPHRWSPWGHARKPRPYPPCDGAWSYVSATTGRQGLAARFGRGRLSRFRRDR